MIKRLVKSIIDKAGLEMAVKKNLWYKDAWMVQKRIMEHVSSPIIFDVGACDGNTVSEYKRLFPDAMVHAFEPQPAPYQNLQKVSSALKNVVANNIALSDQQGSAEFFITAGYASSSLLPPSSSGSFVDDHTVQQQKITVRLETIDQYAQLNNIDHIDILKLDVQGSELSVLKGAAHLLGNGKIGIVYAEIWFTAVYEAQPYFEDIALFLRQYQFRTHGIYDVHFDFLHDARHLWADALFVRPINLHNKSARSE